MDYKDVNLIPDVISHIESRDSVDTSVQFGSIRLEVPLLAAPMVDVADTAKQLKEISKAGSFGFIHRFSDLATRIKKFEQAECPVGCAVGLKEEEEFNALYDAGCRFFCLDIANGANYHSIEWFQKLNLRDSEWVLGNVGSSSNYNILAALPNVIAVRVGLSCGAGCSTANATGIRTPMASLVASLEIPNIAIADGGIKEPGDFCKAIAFGAQYAMAGSVFAQCKNSSARTIDNKKTYSGSASLENPSKNTVPRYIEGKTIELESSNETLSGMIKRYQEGLKSCMSYFNASNIEEFQQYFREVE
jgi:IMP dehydrogenase